MPVAEPGAAQRLIQAGAAALSDAMGKTGAMDHDLRCLSANPKMAGPAYTVRVHTADILMIAQALSECPPGGVLAIDGQGELNTALWGDLTTLSAQLKGLAGVVIDGAIRDLANIRQSALPVFARAVVPNAGGAEYLGEIGVVVQCGGQVVRPGDWLVGDEDGIVVIAAEKLDHTLATAERIVAAEKEIERAIRDGEDLAALLRVEEVIRSKKSAIFVPQLRATPASRRP
ncbi:MAG: RraA family protein [Acidobacteria bacterium]|nr:RraA family protein [Acidobacteriota bacterium]